KPSDVPSEALFGKRDARDVVDEWPLQVYGVLGENDALNHFALRPGLEEPRTVFVPLRVLQKHLGLAGHATALLAGGGGASLADGLRARLDLADWGLVLVGPRERADALLARYDRNRDGRLTGSEWRDGPKPRFAKVIADRIKQRRPNALERDEIE